MSKATDLANGRIEFIPGLQTPRLVLSPAAFHGQEVDHGFLGSPVEQYDLQKETNFKS
jgi:hypothetical protein